jgi:beta-glucosidase
MKDRTYRFMSDPLFPFGYGLSYTTFSIGDAKVSKSTIKNNESVDLMIPVSNTGKQDGTEIVQVYLRKVIDADGPIKTLRGFQRVRVDAGKTVLATITLPSSAFEFYDKATYGLAVTPGEYEVMYGNSSDGKDLKSLMITIQ